jgi:hypothetical protein
MTELEIMRDLEYCSKEDCERCSRERNSKCSFELMTHAARVIDMQYDALKGCGETIKELQDRASMCFSTDKLVERVNSIIEQAIYHGGDSGGPYHCNWDGIIDAMKDFIRLLDKGKYIIAIDEEELPSVKKCDSV